MVFLCVSGSMMLQFMLLTFMSSVAGMFVLFYDISLANTKHFLRPSCTVLPFSASDKRYHMSLLPQVQKL